MTRFQRRMLKIDALMAHAHFLMMCDRATAAIDRAYAKYIK